MTSYDRFTDTALGLVSTQSFPAIVGTADMMLKSSGVTLVGYEMIGAGHCTAVVRGGISDVRLAVQIGAETAERFGQAVSTIIIARPMPNLEAVLPIGSKLAQVVGDQQVSPFRNQAVGLLETRGFPAMVGAADAMLKSADVTLTSYQRIGDGLCTAIVRGTVANVAMAVDVGMQEAERIGELHAVMVIPRALDDLDHTLPIANCWIEELQPLRLPLQVKAQEKVAVELTEAQRQPLALSAQPQNQLPQAQSMEFPELAVQDQELLPELLIQDPVPEPLVLEHLNDPSGAPIADPEAESPPIPPNTSEPD